MKLADLQSAYDYSTLAAVLGINPKILKSHLYGGHSGYVGFQIARKAGGVREISSPVKFRRALQRKLLVVLSETYRPHDCAHGFIKEKSVRSNAEPHVARKTVINVDLKDFFSSISFKRVRGLFLRRPFALHWPVANVLAQICCKDGVLPTGGITSPVISNLILSKLDKKLSAMISRLGGRYSRYADDLTMSFDRPLSQLSSLVVVDPSGSCSIGSALSELIASEGFSVNPEKVRVAYGGARRVVTGLVVNEKANVQRKWLSKLESKIYAVEKFGWKTVASSEYPEEENSDVAVRMLQRRIHGKIAFLHMVRGHGDWLCADLAHRFNVSHDDASLRVPSVEVVSRKERMPRGIFIVLAYSVAAAGYTDTQNQGTAFCIESGLVLTAAHVLLDEDDSLLDFVYVMNERTLVLEKCEVLVIDAHRDVAILKIESGHVGYERHRFRLGSAVASGSIVQSVGYPNYVKGAHASVQQHQIVRKFLSSLVEKYQINGAVSGGLSGAPVVDSKFQVVGLVHRGGLAIGGIPEIISVSEFHKVALSVGIRL